MKNKELARTPTLKRPKTLNQEQKDAHRKQRNLRKRYNNGGMTLKTLLARLPGIRMKPVVKKPSTKRAKRGLK